MHQKQTALAKVQLEERKRQRTVNISTHTLNTAVDVYSEKDIVKTEVQSYTQNMKHSVLLMSNRRAIRENHLSNNFIHVLSCNKCKVLNGLYENTINFKTHLYKIIGCY